MSLAPRLDDQEILRLVGLIYETAEDASQWSVVLERLTGLVGATIGTVDVYDLSRKEGGVSASVHLDPDFSRRYALHFAAKNLWLNNRRDLILPGRTLLGQALVPDDVMLRSEFYQDLLRHEGIFHLIGGRILEKGTLTSNLSLMRPRHMGPFDQQAVSFLDLLMPHFQQAVRLQRRLLDAEMSRSATAEALNRMPVGTILVDGSGQVLGMNKAATEIISARDGLTTGPEGLGTASRKETTALRSLISGAATTATGNGLHPGGTLLVSRPSLGRPLTLQVVPLRARPSLFDDAGAAVAVFVSDPEACPCVAHLASFYELTPAEERMTVRLIQGQTVEEAAADLRISLNTARTHLKSVFLKTGVTRQADLMRLVLTGVTGLRVA